MIAPKTASSQCHPSTQQQPHTSSSSNISLPRLGTLAVGYIGLIGTFVFGAWAVKSYRAAETANSISGQSLKAAEAANSISGQSLQAALDTEPLETLKLNNQLMFGVLCALGNGHWSSSVYQAI